MAELDLETSRALDIARGMVAAGVPVFVAAPCPTTCDRKDHKPGQGVSGTGYHLPPKWETTTTAGNQVDRWRPGWALCAVMGHAVDLADVDPRNGGDATQAALQGAGTWPRSYGRAATPSGGTHDFIAPLRVGSHDNIAPGLDIKGGRPDGTGRGFAFIAPTVRRSKTTGELATYRWLVEPDLVALARGDDSGTFIAETITAKRDGNRPSDAGEFDWDDFTRQGPWVDIAASLAGNPRRVAVFKLAAALRGRGGWRAGDALALMRVLVWPRIDQDKGGHPFPWEEFEANVRSAFEQYPDGPGEAPDGEATDEATPTEQRAAALLARELTEQRVRREARRILDAEERPPGRRPEVLTLRERLARPRPAVAYRIEGWQPVGSRIVLAAQFKAGKTTVSGNAVRSLVDGDPWLGQYKVDPIGGTVVILDIEMSEAQLDGWLADQRITNDDRVIPIPMKGNAGAFDILDPARRAEWAAELRRLNCKYLILDCLRPLLDALGLDEQHDAGRFLTALDALLADAEVPEAAVIHHMGHIGERARGDSRIRDWPDVEWRLVRQDEDPASPRFISAYGRDVDVPESQLSYERVTRHLTVVGGSRKDAAVGAALVDLLAVLSVESQLSTRQLEDRLSDGDHTRAAIRAAIREGIRNGQITTEPGPRRSVLHSQCASAPQCAASAPAQSSECASAPIGGALHSDTADGPVRQPPIVAEGVCCEGGPILLKCGLCKSSPTYWKSGAT